ncbi:MAG: hypothetical protein ACR2GY_06750, partial [Phycisphaerales bacterium]
VITPVSNPEFHATLVLPECHCSTPAVYRAFDDLNVVNFQPQRVHALAAAGSVRSSECFNDLAQAAFAVQPQLRELAREIKHVAEQSAHVTGSGNALFLICDDAQHAETLAAAIVAETATFARAVRGCTPDQA